MQGVRKMLSVFLATVFLLTASFNSVMTHAESLDADKDFSSGRLIVMGNKEMLQDEPVIAELEGMVLIQYSDSESARDAYLRLREKFDFVEVDSMIGIAEGEINDDIKTEEENPFTEAQEIIAELDNEEMDIAVIDTGSKSGGFSLVDENGIDVNGHGQRMIDIILGEKPDARILSIKALGDDGKGSISTVYAAIELAIMHNVKVINISLSAFATEENSIIEEAVKKAVSQGIVVIGAAGNNGLDARSFVPGRIEEAIIVGSTDASSNYGETVDYFVEAKSTSEAAAKASGVYLRDGNFDALKGNQSDDAIPDEPAGDEFEAADTLIYENGKVKVYKDTLAVEAGVIRDGTNSAGSRMRFPALYRGGLLISLTTPSFQGEVREVFEVDGHIAYCFDVKTSAAKGIYAASSSLQEAGITHISQETAEEIASVAYALTKDNFAYFNEIADDIAKGFSNSYESVQKSKVASFLKSNTENARRFKRHIVQWLVWRHSNPEVNWGNNFTNWSYEIDGSGSAGGKEGSGAVTDVPPGYTIGALIDFNKLWQHGLNRFAEIKASASTAREYQYVIEPDEEIVLSGQEALDVWGVYENTGYFGDNGNDVTVSKRGNNVVIKASSNPESMEYGWQYSGAMITKGIYSSKPYNRGTSSGSGSAQFIVDVEAVEVVRAKIEVEADPKNARVGIILKKVDKETGLVKPEFKDAEFTIKYFDNMTAIGSPLKTWVFKADENGEVKYSNEYKVSGSELFFDEEGKPVIPMGVITIEESKAPVGYKRNEDLMAVYFVMDSNREVHAYKDPAGVFRYDDSQGAFENISLEVEEEINRADISWMKVNIDGKKQGGIPFLISRLDSEGNAVESHVVVTDKNGMINTRTRPKTGEKINSLDQYVKDGVFTDDNMLDSGVGVWFGEQTAREEGRGALLYGNYLIEELRCSANQGHDILMRKMIESDEKIAEVFTDGKVFDLENVFVNLLVHVETNLVDDLSGSKVVSVLDDTKVTDHVKWDHLKVGQEYKLKTIIYYEDKGGNVIKIGDASKTFIPEKVDETETSYGVTSNTVEINSRGLTSGKIHAVAEIYAVLSGRDIMILRHNEDFSKEGQTLYFPEPEVPDVPDVPDVPSTEAGEPEPTPEPEEPMPEPEDPAPEPEEPVMVPKTGDPNNLSNNLMLSGVALMTAFAAAFRRRIK